jgi:radical SAM superfamily enzyme YgiQ (UPF0313 family)
VRREPEVTAAALARALEGTGALDEVEGLSFRQGWRQQAEATTVRHNPDRPFLTELDRLPIPARDLVDHRLYPSPVIAKPHTLIITSRGCPYHCTYCSAHLYYGSKLRLRDPRLIGDEIERARREQGLTLFTFWSDTFTLDRGHVVAICEEIRRRNLDVEWMCNSRVDRIDPELLSLMAAAGCRIISFGVESGDQQILDNVRKGITLDQVARAFAWCRQARVKSAAHIILGLPGETTRSIRRTIRLVSRIQPDYVQFYGAIPFPGTAFHRQAVAEKWLVAKDWGDFEINRTIIDTPILPVEALRRWRRLAYLSFYLSPRFIARQLAEVRRPADLVQLVRAGWSFLGEWVFK